MARPRVQLVEPPALTRGRESSVDMELVRELATMAEQGWATTGETYKTHKQAAYQASKFKRHVGQLQDDAKIRTRVWDTSGNNDPEKGDWTWALKAEMPA